jgi:hypothetical protein
VIPLLRQKWLLTFLGLLILASIAWYGGFNYAPFALPLLLIYLFFNKECPPRIRTASICAAIPFVLTLPTVYLPDTAGLVFIVVGIPATIIGAISGYILGGSNKKSKIVPRGLAIAVLIPVTFYIVLRIGLVIASL